MFQKCESAKKLVLVISIIFFAFLLLLFFNCNTNLVLPRLLNEKIWDVIANSKQEEINGHQLPDVNEIEVRFGEMPLSTDLRLDLTTDLRQILRRGGKRCNCREGWWWTRPVLKEVNLAVIFNRSLLPDNNKITITITTTGDSGEIYHQGMFTYNKKHNLLYCLQPKVLWY